MQDLILACYKSQQDYIKTLTIIAAM
jgi:hypothetical protein